jgi:hypothetical protein
VTVAGSKSPSTRNVAVTVHLTEAEAAEVDAARGVAKRDWWIRTAAVLVAEERVAQQAAKRDPKACPPHPKRRVIRGFCGACGRSIGEEKTA